MKYRRRAKQWSGPTVQTLARIFGPIPPDILFVEKARQLRESLNIDGPPFEPRKYAEAMGVEIEEKEDMVMDGLLKRDDRGRFVIHLKKNADPFRKRFTICHELSHTFYFDLLNRSSSFRSAVDFDPVEERLCDIAAAELLMPLALFRKDLSAHATITPIVLFALKNRYRVSLQSIAIRTVTAMRNIACAIWQRKPITLPMWECAGDLNDGFSKDGSIHLKWITPSRLNHLVPYQTDKSSIELALRHQGEVFSSLDSFFSTRSSVRMRGATSSYGFGSDQVFSVITLPKTQQ